jgi:hypothetical protein
VCALLVLMVGAGVPEKCWIASQHALHPAFRTGPLARAVVCDLFSARDAGCGGV